MKQELTDQLITKALDYLKSAEAFAKAEVPAYLQEVITFHIYSNAFSVFTYLFITLISLWTINKIQSVETGATRNRDSLFHTDNLGVPAGIFSCIGFVVGVICFFCVTHDLIKVIVAPRVFLIEYFSQLVK